MEESGYVEWHEWNEETFAVAREQQQPILLALTVSWSPECHEMVTETYGEPRIAANINDAFVPILVDADRNPRVRERYNMGGFPSTVFLTPSGEILAGATYLGPDGFRGILDSVREAWERRGEEAGSVPRALRDDSPPRGTLHPRIEEAMVEQLLATYDSEYGGWGTSPKFPLARTVEFALVRAPEQAIRTLEAIQTHLLDTYAGGFYRFATESNWSGIQREKLTDENAALVRAFAYGYRYTGTESYRNAAERTIEYLTTTLWNGEAFGASQADDATYFAAEPTDRETADSPPVDETAFADRNGLAIDALLRFHAYTDDERARQYATRAREYVCDQLVDSDGCVTHFRTESDETVTVGESGLLLDQARVLSGLTTSWQVCGEPALSEAVADWTVTHLQDEGVFRDGPPGGPGLLSQPLSPLDTAVECADALCDLALLTGERRYRESAREALEAFAGASDRMGVEVAQYATVAARIQQPRAIAVGTPAGTDLHRAALRLADHESVVVPDAHERLDTPAGEARVIGREASEGTAATPVELEVLLTGE